MSVLKYDELIKKSRDLDYCFGIFERSYEYHRHAKFHSQGLTSSGLMTRGSLSAPRGLFISKNPNLIKVK